MDKQEHENVAWRKLYRLSDEFFMAWNYARYLNKVAAAGKAEYPIPMYCNAWLQQPDHAWPGTYPCGGPVPQVLNIWHCSAPSIDILAPDLYLTQHFDEVVKRFTARWKPALHSRNQRQRAELLAGLRGLQRDRFFSLRHQRRRPPGAER